MRTVYMLAALAAFGVVGTTLADAPKSVKIGVQASWSAAPIALEASEFMAEADANLFWEYVATLSTLDAPVSDSTALASAIEMSNLKLSPLRSKLLQFAADVRQYSPRVEMMRQVALKDMPKEPISDAASFAMLDGQLYATPKELEAALSAWKAGASYEATAADHLYPASTAPDFLLPTVVLYGDVSGAAFRELHAVLKQLADSRKVRYVLRHYIPYDSDSKPVEMNGYGVEMAIKNMEYKAVDDRAVKEGGDNDDAGAADDVDNTDIQGFQFAKLVERHPKIEENLKALRQELLTEDMTDKPLKVWELKNLGVQVLQRIRSAPDPVRAMQDISHNLPSMAHSLVKMAVNKSLATSLQQAEQLTMQFGRTSFVSMNQQPLEIGHMDPFSLYETLQAEIETLDGVASLHLPAASVASIRALGQKRASGARLDGRAPTVHYMNDLEEDTAYMRWHKTVQALLQPNWPGQMYYVRKNLYTVIFAFDPSTDDGLRMAAMTEQILGNQMPLRVGIALVMDPEKEEADGGNEPTHDYDLEDLQLGEHFQCAAPNATAVTKPKTPSLGETVIRLYRYIRRKYDNRAGLSFLSALYSERPVLDAKTQTRKELTMGAALKIFSDFLGTKDSVSDTKAKAIFEEEQGHKRYNSAIDNARQYVKEKGFRTLPVMLVNGLHFTGDAIERSLMSAIHQEQSMIQRMVHEGAIDDTTSIHDHVLDTNGASERYHPDTTTTTPRIVSLIASPKAPSAGTDPASMSSKQLTNVMLNRLNYFPGLNASQAKKVTMWVAVDLASAAGVQLASEAMAFLKTKPEEVRLGFIFNHKPGAQQDHLWKAHAATKAATLDSDTVHEFLHVVFDVAKRNLVMTPAALDHLAKKFLSAEHAEAVKHKLKLIDAKGSNAVFGVHQAFCAKVLGLEAGQNALITNGRVVLQEEKYPLISLDLALLYKTELSARASSVFEAVHEHTDTIFADFQKEGSAGDRTSAQVTGDVIMQASSTLLAPTEEKQDAAMRSAYMPPIFDKYPELFEELTVTTGPANAVINIVAALNPLDKDAQHLAPMLLFLAESFPVSVKLILYPPAITAELPYTTFYRYVLPSKGVAPVAVFDKLPQQQLLTMHLKTPEAWLMEPVTSGYDLDNIKLSSITHTSIYARFRIAQLYVQGNCDEKPSGQPPRGLQLELTAGSQSVSDTLVMANLGYFQLKASPGAFNLHIVDGRSSELYSMVGGNGLTKESKESKEVFSMNVDSFTGRHVTLSVKKRPGKEDVDLLEAPEGTELDMWGQIRSKLWGGEGKKKQLTTSEPETIHIFSLASGHLYERFMRIMILSVVKNTKSKVKFWMLKNFLSSKFTDLLPKMAEKYGFEYGLVTYQWPKWLHAQTEKQRIIWGYKILFLDVMFPLDVKKVIYIDADQVVKADIKELWDMSLDGAPLAMVPMGDSRKETEGFRFWKQGFWKSHLAGKPYHISALFVADLEMFRAVAAGDQLRIVYAQLSQDKNSLSNLDQDLPNYTQHQIPIFSLPKEWLYCASWCADSELAAAKTVDLCNNPLTKTPKLEMAKKIVPEWVGLDAEVGKLEEELEDKE